MILELRESQKWRFRGKNVRVISIEVVFETMGFSEIS